MHRLLLPLFFLVLLANPSTARENVPDPALTPGEVLTTDLSAICTHGYSASVRKTTSQMKNETYRAYGVRGSRKHWKIDHLVPLCLGGADTMKNIWPSNFKAGKYNAATKDRLELKIHELVCGRSLPIEEAQGLFISDWRTAYDQYCPNRAACPSYKEKQKK